MTQSWTAREAAAIGRRVAERRSALGISAQQLASRCAELGVPAITRNLITNLETGRREAVTVAELTALAMALGVPPLMLLYPVGAADETEYLPGRFALPWEAARWWAGESQPRQDGTIRRSRRAGTVELFADHQQLIGELDGETEARYQRARRQQSEPGRDQAEHTRMIAVVALREVRSTIRDQGLQPPPVPDELKWLDEEE